MKIKKAVIPAAGLGTRVLPASKSMPKEMLPIVDKPAIQYIVEEAVHSGIEDILIITSRGKTTVEDHFDRNPELEARLLASFLGLGNFILDQLIPQFSSFLQKRNVEIQMVLQYIFYKEVLITIFCSYSTEMDDKIIVKNFFPFQQYDPVHNSGRLAIALGCCDCRKIAPHLPIWF